MCMLILGDGVGRSPSFAGVSPAWRGHNSSSPYAESLSMLPFLLAPTRNVFAQPHKLQHFLVPFALVLGSPHSKPCRCSSLFSALISA